MKKKFSLALAALMFSSVFSLTACNEIGGELVLRVGSWDEYIDEGGDGSTANLVAAHDAATVHLGSPWRMPTCDEIDALVENCTTTWITTNGVSGRLVTGKGAYANRSIFLPAAGYGDECYLRGPGSYGYCWSSTPDSGNPYIAPDLYFGSGDFRRSGIGSRYQGQSVRPVRGFAE